MFLCLNPKFQQKSPVNNTYKVGPYQLQVRYSRVISSLIGVITTVTHLFLAIYRGPLFHPIYNWIRGPPCTSPPRRCFLHAQNQRRSGGITEAEGGLGRNRLGGGACRWWCCGGGNLGWGKGSNRSYINIIYT